MSDQAFHSAMEPPDFNPAETVGADAGMSLPHGLAESLPILPVRGLVVFPGAMLPLSVNRPGSLKLLDEALPQSKLIGILTQRDDRTEDPGPPDLFGVGCVASVLKLVRQSDGVVLLVVQATQRFALRKYVLTAPYLRAEVHILASNEPPPENKQWQAEVKNLRESALQLMRLSPEVPEQLQGIIASIGEPGQLADFLAPHLNIDLPQKQALLEELDVVRRVHAVQTHVAAQLEIAQIQQKVQEDVASRFTDLQRRAYLREQLKAIQRELGEEEPGTAAQGRQLRVRLEEARPPTGVMAQAERELKRLDFIPPASPEYSVIVSYLETLAELPWQKRCEDNLDLADAQRILDRDHFDLEKVKRRLIEHLAVRKLNPKGRGPILCFLGPPGVGKTSLGQSVADALGRKFARMSLGGLHDEAEIRGHRRTYIGSMPGRIIQELRRVGTRNPVLMLDELDKLGSDFRGDPASALLEVLDPQQNHAFVDRYLDVPFDLSDILFIGTANILDPVPPALRDRLEVIELPGYTEREKLEIARRFLLPRQLRENGLQPAQCTWEDGALERVLSDYTHEAGVRELERQVGAVCRSVAAQVARDERQEVHVSPQLIVDVLGPARHLREERLKTPIPGVVTGLAYTALGGELLLIEATRYPGRGEIKITGQLGDVMRESAEAALSLLRSRASRLGIAAQSFRQCDVHIHIPAGAVPKDGPSAGLAIFTALASLFMNTVARPEIAMTGEITLRGQVMPIGGLKEKCLAAMRAGLECVLIPMLNEPDLADVPEEARQKLRLVPIQTVDEALAVALERPIHPELAAAS